MIDGRQNVFWLDKDDHQGLTKVGYPLSPSVVDATAALDYQCDHIYLLVNALGATEFWGQNLNADVFYQPSLSHQGVDYGYQTFLRGHVFAHHANSHPSLGFGRIAHSCWNEVMKRVELIVDVDIARADTTGNHRVIERLEAGEFGSTSMGTKVPFDMCTWCGDRPAYRRALTTYNPSVHRRQADAVLAVHRHTPIRGLSRTSADYCQHLRTSKGKIMDDGTQVGMINDFPNFFDISFVFVGADRTSSVMLRFWPPRDRRKAVFDLFSPDKADEGDDMSAKTAGQPIDQQAVKTALWGGGTAKLAGMDKESAIVKRVMSNFNAHVLRRLVDGEDEIDADRLDGLADDVVGSPGSKLKQILSTLLGLGVVAKRPEFMRLVIKCVRPDVDADDLRRRRILFDDRRRRPSSANWLGTDWWRPSLARTLADLIPGRSFHAPWIFSRAIDNAGRRPPTPFFNLVGDDFLDNIAGAYDNYRQQALTTAIPLAKLAASMPGPLLGLPVDKPGAVTAVYLMNGDRPPRRQDEQEQVDGFISRHPWLIASMLLGGVLSIKRGLRK